MTNDDTAATGNKYEKMQILYDDARIAYLAGDTKLVNSNFALETVDEQAMLAKMKQQYASVGADKTLSDICDDRNMLIDVLKQDMKLEDTVSSQVQTVALLKEKIECEQARPTFKYPRFSSTPIPHFDCAEPKRPRLLPSTRIYAIRNYAKTNNFDGFFHRFLLFLMSAVFYVSISLIISLVVLLVNADTEIAIAQFIIMPIICGIINLIITIRGDISIGAWCLLTIIATILLLPSLPFVSAKNDKMLNAYNARQKGYNAYRKLFDQEVAKINEDNKKNYQIYTKQKQSAEKAFWDEYNSKKPVRDEKIFKLEFAAIYAILQLKCLLKIQSETAQRFALPQGYNDPQTKSALLEHLEAFRARTLTEAINKEESIRFEEKQLAELRQTKDLTDKALKNMQNNAEAQRQEINKLQQNIVNMQMQSAEQAKMLEKKMAETRNELKEAIKDIDSSVTYIDNSGLSDAQVRSIIDDALR